MTSLPAQQSSPRRPEPTVDHSQTSTSPVRTRSATSEDSQTLFLNSPPLQRDEQDQVNVAPVASHDTEDDPSVKRCWICYADSTEDTSDSSPWRDPCPCALVAHEDCLLDWIADKEAPTNTRTRTIGAPRIECPQCKSEIKLARPRNYVVDAVRGIERLGARAVTPGALTVLSATLYNSSMAWGIHSIYSIFGSEDGFRILRPMLYNAVRPPVETYVGEPKEALLKVVSVLLDHVVHWRLYIGLPLITPVLVLSRTKLADSILPVLPILFFATQTHSPDQGLDFTHWPPSASLAFAILPYVRSAYNAYYDRVWAAKEKRWLREIQPRNGQAQADGAANAELNLEQIAEGEEVDGDNVFEVRIDGGIWEDWEEDPGQPQPDAQANRAAPPPQAHNRPEDQEAPVPEQQLPLPQGQAQNNGANNNNGERRLSFSPTALAETVLGALLFPTLAGLSGEILNLLLPSRFTARPSTLGRAGLGRVAAKGLLQEKWGRSLVGGCLLVVAKDAVMLYVRWRMARMHRGRRVLDYDRRKQGSR